MIPSHLLYELARLRSEERPGRAAGGDLRLPRGARAASRLTRRPFTRIARRAGLDAQVAS